LTPGLIFINFLVNRKSATSWKDHFKLPWYLIGFIIITLFGTFVTFSENYLTLMGTIGKIILTIAMGAIGIKVSFKKLVKSGKKGLTLGLAVFLVQILLLALFIQFQ
jgi:uncharacterized membrane protein YadS